MKMIAHPTTVISLAILLGLPAQAGAGFWSASPPEKGAVLQASSPKAVEPAAVSTKRIYQQKPDSSRSYGTENILSEMSKEVAGKVFYQMKDEGQHIMSSRVAVVCAVPLSDLKRETEFGRMVAEYYLTDLVDRGIQVKELRLGKDINILPQSGEFILSQNIGELATESPALDYVVVSTFTNTRKTLILQGRMISLQSGLIKTSWRYNIPLNRELVTLLDANPHPFTIAVKGVVSNPQVNTLQAMDSSPKLSSSNKKTKGHK